MLHELALTHFSSLICSFFHMSWTPVLAGFPQTFRCAPHWLLCQPELLSLSSHLSTFDSSFATHLNSSILFFWIYFHSLVVLKVWFLRPATKGILKFHYRLTVKCKGWGNLWLNKSSSWFYCTLTFESHNPEHIVVFLVWGFISILLCLFHR